MRLSDQSKVLSFRWPTLWLPACSRASALPRADSGGGRWCRQTWAGVLGAWAAGRNSKDRRLRPACPPGRPEAHTRCLVGAARWGCPSVQTSKERATARWVTQ